MNHAVDASMLGSGPRKSIIQKLSDAIINQSCYFFIKKPNKIIILIIIILYFHSKYLIKMYGFHPPDIHGFYCLFWFLGRGICNLLGHESK